MFTKEERSSFKYWFAHWCAFQMTALNLKHWKFRYLFHDIEKPWLKLLLRDYKKVQNFHRKHNKHHLEYYFLHHKADWQAMAIDWECSRFTKDASQLTAYQKFEKMCKKDENLKRILQQNMFPILKKLSLIY